MDKKLLKEYINGNYTVQIYSDGTKIRTCSENILKPNFPENIDCKITDYCDGNCPFCYENCSTKGTHANLNQEWVKTLHPFTELAINGNDLSHPELENFLNRLKSQNVITNITINQKHFITNTIKLLKWQKENLIHGIGISLNEVNNDLLTRIKPFNNIVIHTINGILTKTDINQLKDNNIKLLILGYKNTGRGNSFYNENKNNMLHNMKYVENNLTDLFDHFNLISFDNLAITQLNLKNKIPNKLWNKIYMGDDGTFTFYIDMVKQNFSINSIEKSNCYPIASNVESMFQTIKENKHAIQSKY